VILASTTGSGAVSGFKLLAGAALDVGVGPVEIKEIVYQSVAYVGMGRAIPGDAPWQPWHLRHTWQRGFCKRQILKSLRLASRQTSRAA
jgi:hypothetical protein